MPSYSAPQREFLFILEEVLSLDTHSALPAYAELSRDTIRAFLEGSSAICEGEALPLNQRGDIEGCNWENGEVTTPNGFPEAYRALAGNGWIGLQFDPQYGGKGLPGILAECFYEMLCSANMAFSGFIDLSEAVFTAIYSHGSQELKDRYLPKLAEGEWTGAMHLTEAHAGSDLGLIRTRAEPQSDGTYRIFGEKIFITNAEHDLTDNIVNLVVARLPGAPLGSRGLSLFVVPKLLPPEGDEPAKRNAVRCTSLEHKMGLKAAPTGTYSYEGATGYLVGEEHDGLKPMFVMVNDARLGVAIQGLAIAEVAMQNALAYTRERLQGRSPSHSKVKPDVAVPIIEHPDVRKMLKEMQAFTEAGRGLALWAALQIDISKHHPDEEERNRASSFAALMTPVLKSYFTDKGFRTADLCIQCHGGHGYVRDMGVEQFLRDVRVTRLYEGTNGIQAMDLVRRKVVADRGAGVRQFIEMVRNCLDKGTRNDETAVLMRSMQYAVEELERATQWMIEDGRDPEDHAAGAGDYLDLLGLVAMGWMWLSMVDAACVAMTGNHDDHAFYRRKVSTAGFFANRFLPEASLLAKRAMLGNADLAFA